MRRHRRAELRAVRRHAAAHPRVHQPTSAERRTSSSSSQWASVANYTTAIEKIPAKRAAESGNGSVQRVRPVQSPQARRDGLVAEARRRLSRAAGLHLRTRPQLPLRPGRTPAHDRRASRPHSRCEPPVDSRVRGRWPRWSGPPSTDRREHGRPESASRGRRTCGEPFERLDGLSGVGHRRELVPDPVRGGANRSSCRTRRAALRSRAGGQLIGHEPNRGAGRHDAVGVIELIGALRDDEERQAVGERPERRARATSWVTTAVQ